MKENLLIFCASGGNPYQKRRKYLREKGEKFRFFRVRKGNLVFLGKKIVLLQARVQFSRRFLQINRKRCNFSKNYTEQKICTKNLSTNSVMWYFLLILLI